MAAVLLSNPVVQEKIVDNALKQSEQYLPKQPAQQIVQDDDDDNDNDSNSKKKKKKKKKKSKKDDDDDDDDDQEEEEEEEEDKEEDEEAREERIRKKKENKLKKVNTAIQNLYNIDKENAIKFKKAFYQGNRNDIIDSNIEINYSGVIAKISQIKVKNNKIFSISILRGTQTTVIPRSQIMINGFPVYNKSIIQKIMDKCFDKPKE